jgi:hypothetical protein
MKSWWNGLSTLWKIVLVVAVIIAAIFIWDRISEAYSDYKGDQYEKRYEERMAKVDAIEKENVALRERNAQIDKELVELRAKDQILETNEKALGEKAKQELAKLDEALAAQDAEEARTAQPTDSFTRCERVKQKMIDLGSKTAKEITCNGQ